MKVFKKIYKFFYGKDRYINGTKGVISLFLALLLIPFTMIAGSLVNAARVNSAVAIFDEALCNASNSTLGTYDDFLRKRFGLLAISQDTTGKGEGYTVNDLISETFTYYMEQNLGVLSNTYISSENKVTGLYPLANREVLSYQVLEYSKYTVPAKLVSDGLSLNDMIKSLESKLPGGGVLNLITAGTGAIDSLAELTTDITELKNAITTEENAIAEYNTKYLNFENKIAAYVDTKAEMESELSRIQGEIDVAKSLITQYSSEIPNLESQISSLNTQLAVLNSQKNDKETQKAGTTDKDTIKVLETEIAKLETQISTVTSQIASLENSLSTATINLEKQQSAKTTAESNYATTKIAYEETLAQLQTEINTNKTEYSSSISSLISCLDNTYQKIVSVQGGISDVTSDVVEITTTLTENELAKAKKDNKDAIKKLEEQLENAETEESKAALQQQITDLKETNTALDNQKTVAEAMQSGYDSAMSGLKEDFSSINLQKYKDYVSYLNTIKANVDSYDVSNIKVKLDVSKYYISISELLTIAEVEAAEKNLVNELANESIWAVLRALTGFIKALLNISLVYDPSLSALIDMNYYEENYGGLPAEKDRVIFPLNNGEVGDAVLAQQYKDLFGDYENMDNDLQGNMDIWSLLQRIFIDLGTITAGVQSVTTGMILFTFVETVTNIKEAIEDLKECINTAVEYLKIAIESIGNKTLLSGYITYMTSNRTTYGGAALNGTSFNERGQTSTSKVEVPLISDFTSLFNTISKAIEGEKEKCFVGAETEYIMFGFPSEIGNQAATFAATYLVRILADVLTIVKDSEVASIAAACAIGTPIVSSIVYIIYIFVEPLVDTLILVNGETIPMVKTYVYLTPTGLKSLISKITNIGLTTEQMNQAKITFTEKIGATKYAEMRETFGPSEDAKDAKFFNIDYTQNLFVIMTIFTSSDKMLDRLSNIIQMEAVEYMNNKIVTNGKFDLDHSYTYIRAEAKFTMNEFIKISDDVGIDSKKRIIYRGY